MLQRVRKRSSGSGVLTQISREVHVRGVKIAKIRAGENGRGTELLFRCGGENRKLEKCFGCLPDFFHT